MQKKEKEFFTKFIETYKSLPCLWDVRHCDYPNKMRKEKGYKALLKFCRKYHSDATVEDIKKKINIIRTTYRKELQKVKRLRAEGMEYTPKLWYYNLLSFLEDMQNQSQSSKTLFYDSDTKMDNSTEIDMIEEDNIEEITSTEKNSYITYEDENEDLDVDEIVNIAVSEPREKSPIYFPSSRTHYVLSSSEETIKPHMKNMNNSNQNGQHLCTTDFITDNESQEAKENCETEFDIVGKRVAAHFKNMNETQRLIAEKIITDVLIQGRMNKLRFETQFAISEILQAQDDPCICGRNVMQRVQTEIHIEADPFRDA